MAFRWVTAPYSLLHPSKLELLHRGLEPITKLGETLIPIIWKNTMAATYKLEWVILAAISGSCDSSSNWTILTFPLPVSHVGWKERTMRENALTFVTFVPTVKSVLVISDSSFSPGAPLDPALRTGRYGSVCLCQWLSVRSCCVQCWVHFVALGSSRVSFLFLRRLDSIKEEGETDWILQHIKKPHYPDMQTQAAIDVGMDICAHSYTHARARTQTCRQSNIFSVQAVWLSKQSWVSAAQLWQLILGHSARDKGGWGLTSMFNRKGREGGGEKEMGGFRSSAAITGRLQRSGG